MLLRREAIEVNHKRVRRLYRKARPVVRKRRKQHGVAVERQALTRTESPNQARSMDFVFNANSTCRRIKCMTVVDDFAKDPITTVVDHVIC